MDGLYPASGFDLVPARWNLPMRKRLLEILTNNGTTRDVKRWIITDDSSEPVLIGERRSYEWRTRGGRKIYHPSAYSKSGWSNMVYHSAEFWQISVGTQWLAKNMGGVKNVDLSV